MRWALIDAAYSTCRITCKYYKDDNSLLRMGMPLLVEAPGAELSSFNYVHNHSTHSTN